MARDRYMCEPNIFFRLEIINSRTTDGRQYNLNDNEVAALIVGDLSENNFECDVIVEHHTTGLQRITDLYSFFMSMTYPLIHPYCEDGFRYPAVERLPFHLPDEQLVVFNKNDNPKLVVVKPGRRAYDAILASMYKDRGDLIFIHGRGGTEKTFLWNTVVSRPRSEGKIVLPVATSGIAALLLPNGRTAHSRFRIPFDLIAESTC
ncbi:uncharacterized protein LOC112520001 [Cynara cardunculus var. scolymus]|uniref:uncharacterized protein LOC112520001 n=1 Tax=Cynara cardunculus var. scolymus TaxID=59895 RepID=UPI000D626DCD|nr:uncharacterized protein LOC112520001 [Cynara cardunculus var. scolymus]